MINVDIAKMIMIVRGRIKPDFFKHINTWQTFTLKYDIDGIDAEIHIYISCEEGKIPLNALWNFKNKKFIAPEKIDVKKLLQNIYFTSAGKKQEEKLISELESVLKNFDKPLEDLTDLFAHAYFKGLASTFLPAEVK